MSALASYNPIVIPENCTDAVPINNVMSASVAPTILYLIVGIKAAPFRHWLTEMIGRIFASLALWSLSGLGRRSSPLSSSENRMSYRIASVAFCRRA
jgi:hypothetical protein